ncbi:MAG: hypothetical protein AAF668_00505 [Pseudomonadota bacterium]
MTREVVSNSAFVRFAGSMTQKRSFLALRVFLLAGFFVFSSDQALACSCVLRSDNPAEFIDRAEYIFFGNPIYMTVEESELGDTGYSQQTARTIFLVSRQYKGKLDRRFRGDLPDYFEKVERLNDDLLISVYHGFQSQAACDIRFEFQNQLVMAVETDGVLRTGYCLMYPIENDPKRETEFLDLLETPVK